MEICPHILQIVSIFLYCPLMISSRVHNQFARLQNAGCALKQPSRILDQPSSPLELTTVPLCTEQAESCRGALGLDPTVQGVCQSALTLYMKSFFACQLAANVSQQWLLMSSNIAVSCWADGFGGQLSLLCTQPLIDSYPEQNVGPVVSQGLKFQNQTTDPVISTVMIKVLPKFWALFFSGECEMEIGPFKCGGIYVGGSIPPQSPQHFGSNEYTHLHFIRRDDQLRIYFSKDALCGRISRGVCISFLKLRHIDTEACSSINSHLLSPNIISSFFH